MIVRDIEAAKDFYTRHLAAEITFDCGWYVSMRLGGPDGPEISFATPHHDQTTAVPAGSLSLYIEVGDVDAAYQNLRATQAQLDGPPTDKPWGDRSFAFADPQGVKLYLFSPRPMSAEFAEYVVD
jgi:uncharacterized glyoxalase superfamily protein PhnB